MIEHLLTIPVVVALAFAAWLVPTYCRLRYRNLSMYEKYSNDFYEYCSPLIKDDETPSAVLEMLEFFNKRMLDKRAAWTMLKTVGIGKFLERDKRTPTRISEIHMFLRRRPELKDPYFNAIIYGFIAVSYRGGMLSGFLLRAWMSGGASADDETLAGADPRSEIVAARFLQTQYAA